MSITAPILKLLAAGIIAVGIGAAALGAEDDARQITAAESMEAVMWGRGTIGGPFSLTDHTGRPRTDADFRGKLLLVYFGFTHCPDICPTDLMGVAGALNSLGAQADEVRALFISLDPQRDTQALLSTYVESFHQNLIGLTGNEQSIRRAANAYKVYFAKVPGKNTDDYGIDRTAYIYLMDRDGKFVGVLPPSTSSDRIAQVLKPLLAP